MRVVELEGGVVINGEFPQPEVVEFIKKLTNNNLSLVVTDPPYGNIVDKSWDKMHANAADLASEMINWTNQLAQMCVPGSALYVWGGYGKPGYRPFYKYIVGVEETTPWNMAMHITWKKKRAYGVKHNYLSIREECAYFVLGDIKKPKLFNIPLLEEKRGYAGYNEKYPARSEYYRRTCVWTDITEILRGKIHECQKPEKLYEIPIETHTNERDWVFDPFAGSGTCGAAAKKLKRKFILIERDQDEFDKCVKRLSS
jgi:DNA modification methylase